jgi:hypothetical protein
MRFRQEGCEQMVGTARVWFGRIGAIALALLFNFAEQVINIDLPPKNRSNN